VTFPPTHMHLQVLDTVEVVYDRVVGPEERLEGEEEQAKAAQRVRKAGYTAHVLITDPNDGTKLYEDYWRP
jgi:hypothetical protein